MKAMLRPFRFGMLSEHMQSYQEWMMTVRKTEDYGYAIFLMRDHFIREPFGDQFAPVAALTTAATITKTLRTREDHLRGG